MKSTGLASKKLLDIVEHRKLVKEAPSEAHPFVAVHITMCVIFFVMGWILHSPPKSTPAIPPPEPPTFHSLAPIVKVTAARSTLIWTIPYLQSDSASLAIDDERRIVSLQNSTLMTPSSLGRLYVEAWSSGAGAPITFKADSPCELYAIDLHAGPHCVATGEEEDCSALFVTLQTYANVTTCAQGWQGRGIKSFYLGITRHGNMYGLEQRGFENGTDLVRKSASF
ncbi:hypothetical protein JCM11491_006547 [Sporobolomyces phaffii]